MDSLTNIDTLLDLWTRNFPAVDFPEVRYLNLWRMKYSPDEISYALEIAQIALMQGRIASADTERIGQYVSATLKKQRQQHNEINAAIGRRRAQNGGAL